MRSKDLEDALDWLFRAEVDFIIEHHLNIVPIEVKAEQNLQAKSLKSYCQKYAPTVAVRTSMHDYYKQQIGTAEQAYTLVDLPLYAICNIAEECSEVIEPL